jgi:hypothetical protein
MTTFRLRRPRYADVAATLALFLAMGGTAYAVSTVVAPNSVNTAAIQDGAVTSPKLAAEAVNASKIEPGAVGNAKLAPGAVTNAKIASGAVNGASILDGSVGNHDLGAAVVGAGKLADGAVTHSKLAANSVTGADVSNGSITLADLRGIDVSGTMSYTLLAHACGKLTLAVSGATAGQVAVLSWTGAVPTHTVIGPLKVVSSTQIITYACNLSGTQVSVSGIGFRVVTFG